MAGLKKMSKSGRALKSIKTILNPKNAWNPKVAIDRSVADLDTLYNGDPLPPPGPPLEMPDPETVGREKRRDMIRRRRGSRQSSILSDSLG